MRSYSKVGKGGFGNGGQTRPQKSDVIYGYSLPSFIKLNVDYLNLPEQAFGHLAVQVAAPAKAVEAAGFEAAETSELEVIYMVVVLESGE